MRRLKARDKGLLSAAAMYGAQSVASYGAIVHIDNAAVSVTTNGGGSVTWDIDQDTTNDATFTTDQGAVSIKLDLTGVNLNGFARKSGDPVNKIQNLANGFSVQATMEGYAFNTSDRNFEMFGSGGTTFNDPRGFSDNVAGNVGFRFNISGSTHYGWARWTLDIANPASLTISEWAYNDVAGGAIQVGAVPEPAETGAEPWHC